MGSGLANVLGGAAAGFEQARQADLTRQFADEQNRRDMAGQLLQHIALDENQHPDVRNAALQSYLGITNMPGNKNMDFNKSMGPVFDVMAKVRGQTQQPQQGPQAQFTPPPSPPLPGSTMPLPNRTVTLNAPPTPPGVLATAPEVTQNVAQRVGQVTGAEAGAAAKFPVLQRDPVTGEMRQVYSSGTGQPIGQAVENAYNPMMFRHLMSGVQQIQYVGPNGQPLPGSHDKLGLFGVPGAVYDQQGQLVPNAQLFAPSLVSRTGTESMNAAGQVTKKTTPTAPKPTTAAPQLAAPPAPPESIGGVPLPTNAEAGIQSPQPSGAGAQPTKARGAAAPAAQARGGAAAPQKPVVGTPEWIAKADPVSLDAWDWATQGRKPTGGPMAERQVRQRMAQMGFTQPAIPVPPNLQHTIQEQFVARNSAIGLIDDVLANKKVFDSLLSSGKIAIASNPDGTGIVQRAAGLTDQEARVAGDFEQLIEHANLLRGPLGATGFRGQQAWSALQAQRGKPLGDPRITQQVLSGMRDRLVGLNSADKLVLTGQGMSGAGAEPHVLGHKVGDVTTIKGKQYKITAIHDDGSFDADAVGAAK